MSYLFIAKYFRKTRSLEFDHMSVVDNELSTHRTQWFCDNVNRTQSLRIAREFFLTLFKACVRLWSNFLWKWSTFKIWYRYNRSWIVRINEIDQSIPLYLVQIGGIPPMKWKFAEYIRNSNDMSCVQWTLFMSNNLLSNCSLKIKETKLICCKTHRKARQIRANRLKLVFQRRSVRFQEKIPVSRDINPTEVV